MADIIDQANDKAEAALQAAISEASYQASRQEVAPTGICLNCGEPVSDDLRWCDEFCRYDWTKRQRRI